MVGYIITPTKEYKYMSTNNKDIFSITTTQFNLGTVFLIWSIHKITGHTEYFDSRTGAKRDIPKHPLLKGITAHKMRPNYCSSVETFEKLLGQIPRDGSINHLKVTPEVYSLKQYHEDVRRVHQLSKGKKIKVVHMTCRNLQHLIGFLRFDYEQPNWQNDIEMVKKHCSHYWPNFFEHRNMYQNKLETWHDIREAIALNIRPDDFWTHYQPVVTDEMLYTCQMEDLLTQGKDEMCKVLNFLGFDYRYEDLNDWCDVNKEWSDNLHHYIEFCNDIDIIVETIISNKQIDLTKYRLDVLKESILLHFLIFKHDLNLHSGIDKFPTNTREIHSLLVQNQRTGITKLYD